MAELIVRQAHTDLDLVDIVNSMVELDRLAGLLLDWRS